MQYKYINILNGSAKNATIKVKEAGKTSIIAEGEYHLVSVSFSCEDYQFSKFENFLDQSTAI